MKATSISIEAAIDDLINARNSDCLLTYPNTDSHLIYSRRRESVNTIFLSTAANCGRYRQTCLSIF
jgi:hypothetical protein